MWLDHFEEMSIARIDHIDIYVNKYGSVKPMYWVVIPPSNMPIFKYEEKELFLSKEELLKSLNHEKRSIIQKNQR